MADLTKTTKIVEYQLQGNTVNLERTIEHAIKQLNILETKMQGVASSTATRPKQSLGRATDTAAIAAQSTKIASTLQQNFVGVTPAQLQLLQQASLELDKLSAKLNKVKTPANKTLEETREKLDDIKRALRDANLQVDKHVTLWDKFKDVMKNNLVSVAFWLRLIQKAIQLLVKGYESAADFAETINLFNVAIKNSTGELKELAEAMTLAFSTDPAEVYNTIATLRQYANALGLAADASDLLAQSSTQLVYDLASLYNTTNTEMLNAFKSGLAGLTKPLMRFGISVHRATVEQTALELGIKKTWGELNESEKVLLRYLTILKETTGAHGDLARTLESPQNQLKIASAQLKIFIRNLGSFAVIAMQIILPVFNALMIAVNKFLSAMAAAAGYTIEDYSDNLSENAQAFDEDTEAVEEYEDALKGLLTPLDEINQQSVSSADSLPGAVDPAILAALESYDNLMSQISTKTDAFAAIFSSVFDSQLFKGIGSIIGTAFDTFGKGLEVVMNLLDAFSPILGTVLKLVGYLLEGVGWLITNVIGPVMDFVKALTSNIWLLIGAFVALNLAQLAVTGQFKAMTVVKIIQFFGQLGVKIWENVSALIANAAAAIKAKLASAALAIQLWWETAAWWQKAIAIIAAAGVMALVVAGIVIAATTAAKAKATSTMNTPALASGAVVTAPTVALIGEGRYNEAVVPLGNSPQFRAMKEDIAAETLKKLTPSPYIGVQHRDASTVVKLVLNDRELARAITPALDSTYSQTGVRLKTR